MSGIIICYKIASSLSIMFARTGIACLKSYGLVALSVSCSIIRVLYVVFTMLFVVTIVMLFKQLFVSRCIDRSYDSTSDYIYYVMLVLILNLSLNCKGGGEKSNPYIRKLN